MNKRDIRYMNIAQQEAENSTFKRNKTACVVVYKKTIIAVGHNSERTHPIQYKYNHYRLDDEGNPGDDFIPKIHAEIDALSKIKYMDIDFSQVHLYIYRKCKSKYGIARPCKACMRMIMELGIKKIYYSTNYNFIEEEIISNKETV